MSTGHRSSSSRRAALLVMTSMLGMAGCSGGAGLLRQDLASAPIRNSTIDQTPEIRVVGAGQATAQPADPVVAAAARTEVVKAVPVADVEVQPQSAWCEYLREDTAADATILRAPTVSGSVYESGKASLDVGLSITGLHKANLMEKSAEIKCRRYLAELGLQKLAFVAPQGLTAAGFKAKAASIDARTADLKALRKQINRALAAGDLTREKATQLTVLADQIVAEASNARSQADRRLAEFMQDPQAADVMGRQLLRAEADMADVTSQMRTADAVDVSLHAGWNDADTADGFDTSNDAFSGRVSFSMKLGAFNPSRYEHERKAKDARLRAIQQEEGGALWQISVLRRAHEKALEGLSESRQKLDNALAEAERLVSVLASVQNPEFRGPLIAARLQVIRLRADKAAIDGSVAEIRQNMKKLQQG